ncbi:thymidylate synthase [Krasilnikovia sp. M28-CT-15]|uniref:thymidylate synthase n=1 Tax=Krasilnikovia sp. M28-CT-15 TaxID=3373540 RepID=UPI0038776113
MSELRFEALYYPERLRLVNMTGDVGIITLWTQLPVAERRLASISADLLDPGRSRIAVVANLYGDGMYAMFCNLLYNPQIRYLVALGQRLGQTTTDELQAFLDHGLEETDLLGTRLTRITGTSRYFPTGSDFPAERLRSQITFRAFGDFSDPRLAEELIDYLEGLPRAPTPGESDRIRVMHSPTTPAEFAVRPSSAHSHEVSRARPLECWRELVTRVMRFGRPVPVGSGTRLELLNVKAVVTHPVVERVEALAQYGFELDRLLAYQRDMLRSGLPAGVTYTYGNRMRGYIGDGRPAYDALRAAADLLAADPHSRHAYVDLWDTKVDLEDAGSVPCLTTLFFRVSEEHLTLSATYRAHNLLIAWIQNIYGLMAIQSYVAESVGLPIGPITVLSHSLGIDPSSSRYPLGRAIANDWDTDDDLDPDTGRHVLRADPNGYFVIKADEDSIVAEHRYDGLLLKQYRAKRAAIIERQIISDHAVSLVSHAIWVGRQLERAENELRDRGTRPSPARWDDT